MKITVIDTGFFKLDGGAMFGVVPKKMWQKMHPCDENNMCTWAMRCLLVQTDNRNILIDTGFGNKQDAKFRSHFEPHGKDNLMNSLKTKAGLEPEEITDVFLTHLHFDHVGGAIDYNDKDQLTPAFPNAVYWTNEKHYNWALEPNARERASFLKENFVPLKEQGVLKFIDVEDGVEFLPGFNVRFVYGHTEAMMLPEITVGDRKVLYCADLMPSPNHVGLPYVMSYDIRPLVSIEEKKRILTDVLDQGIITFFEHAPEIQSGTLKRNERGRIVMDQIGDLSLFVA